jgi:hypothetical protein
MQKRAIRIILQIGAVFLLMMQASCRSSKSPNSQPEAQVPNAQGQVNPAEIARQQGISELRRIHDSMDELRVIAEGGISGEEFSRRFTDSLLKVGDLETSKQRTLTRFPGANRASIAEVYVHFQNAIDAYKESKRFFGGPGTGAAESEYSELKQKFPLMPAVQSESDSVMSDHRYYPAPTLLNALWVSAIQENRAAADSIATLEQQH